MRTSTEDDAMDAALGKFLSDHGVAYVLHTHAPVFTCEEAAVHCAHIPGIASKNLFLKDDAGRFYLVTIPDEKRLDVKAFRVRIGAKKLRFGNDAELHDMLRLTPGSVSPFGLINDAQRQVIVYIDSDVWDSPIVQFHPNINTETLELTQEMFRKFLSVLSIAPIIAEF